MPASWLLLLLLPLQVSSVALEVEVPACEGGACSSEDDTSLLQARQLQREVTSVDTQVEAAEAGWQCRRRRRGGGLLNRRRRGGPTVHRRRRAEPTPGPPNDDPNCKQPQGCDFRTVLYTTGQGTEWNGYQYAYKDDWTYDPYPCPDGQTCSYDWVPQSYKWIYLNSFREMDEVRFQYVETVQYVLGENDQVTTLNVWDLKSSYPCVRALYEDGLLGDYDAGADISLPTFDASSPLHITFIPFTVGAGKQCSGGPSCDDSAGCFDAQRALVLFLSKYADVPTPDIAVTADNTCDDGAGYKRYGCWDDCKQCAIIPPYWTTELSDDGTKTYLVYRGSLVDYQTNYFQCTAGGCPDMTIKIDESVDIDIPVNNMLARAEVDQGSCNIDASGWVTGCTVKNFEFITLAYGGKINIYGFGRINNFARFNSVDLADWWHNADKAKTYPIGDADFQNAFKYMLYSGSLILSSSVQGSTAIDVSGISVGFGPKRYSGPVQLNTAYTPATATIGGYPDESLNSGAVKVFDVKVVGNWRDGADCMEVQGFSSVIDSVFCHANDDSIKLIADGLQVSRVTVFQGNTGSAISLGGYGFNRGTGAEVKDIYVHRITQNTLDGFCNQGYDPKTKLCAFSDIRDTSNSYDGFGGLVSSRTCPTNAFQGGTTGLVNIDIEQLMVVGLGWVGGDPNDVNDGVPGPNSVSALFSFGLLADGIFCEGKTLTPNYPVNGNTFKDWTILTNPVWPSLIYNNPCNGGGDCTNAEWEQVDPSQSSYSLYTGKVVNGAPLDDGVVVYPFGTTSAGTFYWVCATDKDAEASECWAGDATSGSTQGSGKNTDYVGSTVGNAIVFPYGS